MSNTATFPHRFNAPEVELASGFSYAAIRSLMEFGHTNPEGGGKGVPRFWDPAGLAHLTVAGGLYLGGLELVPASRLARAICTELTLGRAELPDNLEAFKRQRSGDPWSRFMDTVETAFAGGGLDKLAEPQRHDTLIVIADRDHVFQRQRNGLSFMTSGAASVEALPLFRITDRKRGQVDFVIERAANSANPETEIAKVEREFAERWAARVATLELNVSLCLRRGLLAVFTLRRDYSPDGKGWPVQ